MNVQNSIKKVNDCTGCRSCEQNCPQKAISFIENEEGFLFPTIEEKLCVNCGKCLRSCPQFDNSGLQSEIIRGVYVGLNNNQYDLMTSSSGGIMSAIATYILKNEGIVFGARLDLDTISCYTDQAQSLEELDYLKGSKYVQCNTGDVFSRIENQLKIGKMVLYVAVPCQIAGLKKYLNNEYENLITVDILCHGVPSIKLLRSHISYLEKKYKGNVKELKFRAKDKFPNKSTMRYLIGKKRICLLGKCDPYYQTFISGIAYRECCYTCNYASTTRVGDITLGDYWGVNNFHKDFDNSKGVSLVIVNTSKGEKVLNECDVQLLSSKIENAIPGNGILTGPSKRHPARSVFYQESERTGYIETVKKYVNVKPILYNKILSLVPQNVLHCIDKMR